MDLEMGDGGVVTSPISRGEENTENFGTPPEGPDTTDQHSCEMARGAGESSKENSSGSGSKATGKSSSSSRQMNETQERGDLKSHASCSANALKDQNQNRKKARPCGYKPPPAKIIKLADNPTVLKEGDVKCPICWNVLFEPTTLPCNHSLCIECFLKHVAETSLYCPCCRRRVSVWCRKVAKKNELLDVKLWKRIQDEFPESVGARVSGLDSHIPSWIRHHDDGSSSQQSDSSQFVRDAIMDTQPGEIFNELKQILVPHENDIESQRRLEEAASAVLIDEIQQNDMAEEKEAEKANLLMAKTLSKKLNGPVVFSSSDEEEFDIPSLPSTCTVQSVQNENSEDERVEATSDGDSDTENKGGPASAKQENSGFPFSPSAIKLRLNTDDYMPKTATAPAINSQNENDEYILGDEEYSYLQEEANLLQQWKERLLREAADQKMAKTLQENFDMGIDSPRGKNFGNEYSLRSWKK